MIFSELSYIYFENFFYSDSDMFPNDDKLKHWYAVEEQKSYITQECNNKKNVVFQLDINNEFALLGATIMLANVLREQDPLSLNINQDKNIYEEDIYKRHEHYISAGCPDTKWIRINIFLRKDDPIRNMQYASFGQICEINNPVDCDNYFLATMVGADRKVYLNFDMEDETLKNEICKYFNKINEPDILNTIMYLEKTHMSDVELDVSKNQIVKKLIK